jgi:prolipoprotein diacylglyceryltransferase
MSGYEWYAIAFLLGVIIGMLLSRGRRGYL